MSNEASLPETAQNTGSADAAEKPPPALGSLPFDLLAEPLRGQIEWVLRRHGLTPAAASLAVLATVLGICGPSRRIHNPIDTRSLPSALSVVLYGCPAAYIQAAVEVSLDQVRQWVVRRIDPPDKSQLRRARLRLGELHQARITKESHVNSAGIGAQNPGGEFGGALAGSELETHQKTLKEELAKIVGEINDVTFLLRPYLLVDDTALPRLLNLGCLSTDGAVLHTSLAGHAVKAWTGVNSATKAELARLLHLAWHGLPDAGDEDCHAGPRLSNVLVTDRAGAKSLWSDQGLVKAGVVQHLFFVEAAQCETRFDPSAGCPEETAKRWIEGLQALLHARLAGHPVEHGLDRPATEIFEAFARGLFTQAHTFEADEARRLERTPVLALKLALLIHAISPGREDHAIGPKTTEFACAMAMAICANDLQFTNADKPGATTPGGYTVSALVTKLRLRGPLRWRELLRSQRVQKAEPLEKLLAQAISVGLVRKEGDLYHAVDPAGKP